jgi:hypothetical protein
MAGADASFAIEIAAQMGGAEQTSAELDRLTSAFMGAGKNASAFQDAIKQVSGDLDMARAAQEAANTALAAGAAEYARLETAALQASKAAEKLARGGMTAEYLQAARASAEAEAAVMKQADALRGLETAATTAGAKEEKLAQTFANVKKLGAHTDKTIAAQAESLEKLGSGLGVIPGPLGRISQGLVKPFQGFAKLSASMGTTNAAALLAAVGIAAVALAVAAVGVALVAATIKVASWAIGLADSARNTALSREAMEAWHPELVALRGEIDATAEATGMHADELSELAGQLRAAKVSAEDMPDALRAVALAETALGKGGAAEFIAEIKKGERSVQDLAQEAKDKLGGKVAKQMKGLNAQSAKLEKRVGEIFGGLNIEPVLNGLSVLVDLFDKNTAAGGAMKFLFESVFQPIIDQATNAAYVVEAFAIGFLIGLTKVYIALKPAIKAIGEFFGFEDTSLTDVLALASDLGEMLAPVFVVVVAVFTALVGTIALVVAAFAAFGAAIIAIPVYINNLAASIGEALGGAFNSAISYITSIDWAATGTSIMTGLAAGITASASAVWNAITGAVQGAINAAKNLLGIHSPSKLFAGIGEDTAAGMTEGVDDGASDVQGAMVDMVAPDEALRQAQLSGDVSAIASPVDAPQTTAGGSGAGFDFQGATFTFNGVKDAEHAKELFEEMLRRFAEGSAAQLGVDGEALA